MRILLDESLPRRLISELAGHTISTVTDQGGTVPHDELEAAILDPVRTVISADGWKPNCSPPGEHELYNLKDDPGETLNIFKDNKDRARELRDEILKWQSRTGDAVGLPQL